MVSNAIKAAVVVLLAVALVAVLYMALKASPNQHPQTSITTTAAEYNSLGGLSNRSLGAISNENVSMTYVYYENYPSTTPKASRSIDSQTINYTKYGSLANFNFAIQDNLNNSNTMVDQLFYVNGTEYICAKQAAAPSYNCSNAGALSFNHFGVLNFLNLSQRVYVTKLSGLYLSNMSALVWTNSTDNYSPTFGPSHYVTVPFSYFHTDLHDPKNPAIHGNLTIYTSTQYGVPVWYQLLLNDPAYSASNNTLMIQLHAVDISTNVSKSSVMPPYLAQYLK